MVSYIASKVVAIKIRKSDLETVDKAKQIDCRTRNSFLVKAALDRAKKIMKGDDDGYKTAVTQSV